MAPEKFFNVTNGVTPRRWLALSNPRLSALITRHIGDRWIADLEHELRAPRAARRRRRLPGASGARSRPTTSGAWPRCIQDRTGIVVDPASLFDIQVKRLHEYKRQHLNVLHLITLYNRLERARRRAVDAAHGDLRRQGGARLPHGQADHQADQRASPTSSTATRACRELLKVVFLPDFNVKNGQHIYPAADLSEQISTAGKEASGTGNMKFAMNGALTIGTLDGANVEIRDAVGAGELLPVRPDGRRGRRARRRDGYRPRDIYESNAELREAIDLIGGGLFSERRPRAVPAARRVAARRATTTCCSPTIRPTSTASSASSEAYRDQDDWTRMSILNAARVGRFSSDRSIREYCRDIWHVTPPIDATATSEAHDVRGGDAGEARASSTAGRERAARRHRAAAAASTSACSRRTPTLIELLLFDDAQRRREPARDHPARSASAHRTYHYWHAFVPGLAAGPGLRLPRARAVRAGTRAAVRCARRCCSIRTASRSRCPTPTTASAASRPGDNVARRDEERRRRSRPLRLGRRSRRSGGRSPRRSSTSCTCAASRGIRARASRRRSAAPTPA